MEPLTLKRALHLLHVRTAALENIRKGSDLADFSPLAGYALSCGPDAASLVAMLANMPTPCETGGGLACPRCGWDSLQPSDDPPETVAAHRRGCPALLAATGAVGVECSHGFDACPTCDRCTCNDAPRDCSPAARRVNLDRNAANPCPRCVGSCFVTINGGGWILCETCDGTGRGPVAVVSPEVAAAFGLQPAAHVRIKGETGGSPFVCISCGKGRDVQAGPCPSCGSGLAGLPDIRRPKPKPAPKPCPDCDGDRIDPDTQALCRTCKGTGAAPVI